MNRINAGNDRIASASRSLQQESLNNNEGDHTITQSITLIVDYQT